MTLSDAKLAEIEATAKWLCKYAYTDSEAERARAELAVLASLRDARAETAELRARIEALCEKWRYKGEFGWGNWQEGEGPDQEGYVLDRAASELRATLSPAER